MDMQRTWSCDAIPMSVTGEGNLQFWQSEDDCIGRGVDTRGWCAAALSKGRRCHSNCTPAIPRVGQKFHNPGQNGKRPTLTHCTYLSPRLWTSNEANRDNPNQCIHQPTDLLSPPSPLQIWSTFEWLQSRSSW